MPAAWNLSRLRPVETGGVAPVGRGHDGGMEEHESPERPERQTEHEEQQYPGHGHPEEQGDKVGLPRDEEKREPDERGGP